MNCVYYPVKEPVGTADNFDLTSNPGLADLLLIQDLGERLGDETVNCNTIKRHWFT